MKKMFYLLFLIAFLIPITVSASSGKYNSVASKLEKSFKENFNKRGLKGVEAKVRVLEKLKEVNGYYFVQVDINDKDRNQKVKQFVISDGERLLPDVINLKHGSSLIKDLTFKYDNYKVDTSGLTLIEGSKSAKNIIVKVGDFQCPFCKKAHDELSKMLKGKEDYAVYMMHLPLKIHNQAVLRAKIFEAGKKMGKNFENDLYHLKQMPDDQVINIFASKSGNSAKFKKLLNSKEIERMIKSQEKRATSMGLSSTPVIFINGKKVLGFNPPLMKKALESFK